MGKRRLCAGNGIWAGVLLFFWNAMYGINSDVVETTEDLFFYTSSSVGIQAPFLHASAFLIIFLMLCSYYMTGDRIYIMYRMPRKSYGRILIKKIYKYAMYFVGTYMLVYSFKICQIATMTVIKQSGFFMTLLFYGGILWTFYSFFGLLFLLFDVMTDGKWTAMIITIVISMCFLCVFYFTVFPTMFHGMDVFDMVYYQKSILIFTYGRRVVFNLLCLFIAEYVFLYILQRKDVIENEKL